jgi:lysine 6-dehydrogenase
MNIAVIGLGIQGYACAYDLARAEGVRRVVLYDPQKGVAEAAARKLKSRKVQVLPHALRGNALASALKGVDAVACTAPYHFIPEYTRMAIRIGAHFSDLGGHYQTVEKQLKMDAEARRAGVTVLPDCGLAPGLAVILAYDMAMDFSSPVRSLRIRVGGLPQKPRGFLKYAKFFNPHGLLNEYWNDCVVVENGKTKKVEGMTGVERLRFAGIGELEAFHTSGGIGRLPQTLKGRARNMDYKTIRYPGHCEKFRVFQELSLDAETMTLDGREIPLRDVLVARLNETLPEEKRDVVLMRIDVEGKGRRRRLELVDRFDPRSGLTAMQRTTAFSLSGVVQQLASGVVKKRGAMPIETGADAKRLAAYLKTRGFSFTARG